MLYGRSKTNLSLTDALIVLSNFFRYHASDNLPSHFLNTMRSIWIGPMAVTLIALGGLRKKRFDFVLLFSTFITLLLIFLEIMGLIPTPRSFFSRFPISDYRGALHCLLALIFGISMTKIFSSGNDLPSFFKLKFRYIATAMFFMSVGIIVALFSVGKEEPWHQTKIITFNSIFIVSLVIYSLLMTLSIRNSIAKYSIVVIALLQSFSLHFVVDWTWNLPFDFDYKKTYGPHFKNIPAGEREMADIKYRPARIALGKKIYVIYGNNVTAFFNGQYANGIFQHSGHAHTSFTSGVRELSKTILSRRISLMNDPTLTKPLNLFLSDRSQVLFAPEGQTVESIIKARDEHQCLGQAACLVAQGLNPRHARDKGKLEALCSGNFFL